MKRNVMFVVLGLSFLGLFAQDWDGIPVPADAGEGMMWELQDMSDDFNYSAPADDKGEEFNAKWTDFYHNAWTGPGLTVWDREHVFVADSMLQIIASRYGAGQVNTGCITSTERVSYPAYVEAYAKLANNVLASDVWMLSPDDTQEIDIIEAYGASWSDSADSDQTWFAKRIHLSHHVFIRDPFQDYQPTDGGSWYSNGTTWREDYHRVGVHWIDPWNLKYYIDGNLVRTTTEDMIDPNNFTEGTGLNKDMDIIINCEDQTWRSDQNITPTTAELENIENNTFKVDWVRVYKPVADPSVAIEQLESEEASFSVYPNPVNGNQFTVQFNEAVTGAILEVLDITGRTLTSLEVTGSHYYYLDAGIFPDSGLFLLKLNNGANQSFKKVFVM